MVARRQIEFIWNCELSALANNDNAKTRPSIFGFFSVSNIRTILSGWQAFQKGRSCSTTGRIGERMGFCLNDRKSCLLELLDTHSGITHRFLRAGGPELTHLQSSLCESPPPLPPHPLIVHSPAARHKNGNLWSNKLYYIIKLPSFSW